MKGINNKQKTFWIKSEQRFDDVTVFEFHSVWKDLIMDKITNNLWWECVQKNRETNELFSSSLIVLVTYSHSQGLLSVLQCS